MGQSHIAQRSALHESSGWAEAGPAALLAWLWIFGATIWRSLRAARAGDTLAKGVVVALLGFALFSLADHPSNVDRVAIALWITLGLAAGATPLLRRHANLQPHANA